jgi:glycerol-3-phosphate acyltransferase PlsY
MTILHAASVLLLAYLAGSLPTSILIGRIFFKKDIRDYGSGNAGGTNALRVFGWPAGIAVILVDIAKGAAAVLLIARLPLFGGMEEALLPADALSLCAGIAAVLGHIWTVFASFRGGKGVATAAGMIAALYPLGFAAALAVFVLGVLATGIISVGSIAAAVSFPALLLLLRHSGITQLSPFLLWLSLPIALLIIFTHRRNIVRLLRGEEKRLFGPRGQR